MKEIQWMTEEKWWISLAEIVVTPKMLIIAGKVLIGQGEESIGMPNLVRDCTHHLEGAGCVFSPSLPVVAVML